MPLNLKSGEVLTIGLVNFEPLRVTGLRSILEAEPQITVRVVSIEEVLADHSIGFVLFGLSNPPHFDRMSCLRAQRPDLKLIVVGMLGEDETIIDAIAVGAKGYVEETAQPEQLLQAIAIVHSGSIWAPRRVLSLFVDRMLQFSTKPVRRHNSRFTEREQQVLRLLVAARSNREIAETLGIEERTVKAYIKKLMSKVGVDNRVALSLHAATSSLVDD
ncbi:MAG: LuxR C-terminal-related transcriptional regulator [Acidobacteriaceae bacterium]